MCINIVIGSSKIKLLGLMKKLNFDLNNFKYLKNYNLCSEL
jgi:hypothetical protein